MILQKFEFNVRAKWAPLWEWWFSHIRSAFFKDLVTQFLLIPSVALISAVWIFSLYYFRVSPYQVPLRYNSFLGVFSLGGWYEPYLMVLTITVCLISNILLAKSFYEKDKFLSYTVIASNIFLAMIALTIVINFGRMILG